MVLRVILQIVPHGDEDNVREIGRLDIFNKGPFETGWKSEYRYGVIDLTPKQEGLFSSDVRHAREDGAWVLVHRVLNSLSIR